MHPGTILALVATLLPTATAAVEYCYPEGGAGHKRCFDGTRATPCCGVGPCNIFCANCDGGCRKRPSYDRAAFDRATAADTAELTLRQYTLYMGVAVDDPVYVDWFRRHDRNGDGVVTFDELRLDGRSEL
ncbi:uncharacterized protein K452DRAFT_297296 [Aplosporella prunicola CBS 121167]|uniref:EF-hand domain-containing protein n=1 Tax=Aplosporella prunicola CBS 121167 TaxID=1176127 RepID=A0A6A6BF22_9PEZI|nr:uncharacterized protein K452DRAFT_297296 [Aplosporella prunicola CBS 121167]KAF2142760.1 hypothetical protein K452DRAFT_297296 [Aplosporella prunicola CBS 121167]